LEQPTIYYLCCSHNRPAGGNKHTYRHVDALVERGFRAAILHLDPQFTRLTWFENQTPTLGPARFASEAVPERDFLVVPEDIGGEYRTLPCRKVVFNKNIYYGAAALNSDGGFDRYLDGDTVAAFAVSDANSAYLRYAYPRLKIFTLYPEVDSAAFFHQPVSAKKRIIAVGPKGRRDVITLVQLLKARRTQGLNALAGWKCVLLEGLTEAEVAATLADSTVFISLSTAEGLARMPLEAMSAGCLVAAYDVGSAQEYLPPSSRFQVGDFVGIAKWVEAIAAAYGADRPALDDVARPGRALALRYSRQRQVDAVAEAWTEILATGNR
jgi:hypothetical protein